MKRFALRTPTDSQTLNQSYLPLPPSLPPSPLQQHTSHPTHPSSPSSSSSFPSSTTRPRRVRPQFGLRLRYSCGAALRHQVLA